MCKTYGVFFVAWDGSDSRLLYTFDNYDEADNRRLTLESRYGTDEGYYLVAEV